MQAAFSTVIAKAVVDANHAAALGASPPCFFVPKKIPYAQPMDIPEILDHAHAISGPVSFVEMLQAIAGEFPALKTEPGILLMKERTPPDFTFAAGDRFSCVISPTAGAFVLFPQICHADTAIHAARGDQRIFSQSFHGMIG